jgi:hypothetical protein
MTAERMASLARWWARLYTHNLPAADANRRTAELDADLHDHVAHERARGTGDRSLALAIAGRLVRGMPADVAWRAHTIARTTATKEKQMTRPLHRSAARIALVTLLVLLVPFVWMQFSDDAAWSGADFVLAGALLVGTGVVLELAARHARSPVFRVLAIVIALAAMALGEADDAPGLVLFGLVVIASTVVLWLRAPKVL